MDAFDRLIRFVADDGTVLYGDVQGKDTQRDIVGQTVPVVEGDIDAGFKRTDRTAVVKKLPVARYPVVFTKPPDALTGPYDDVEIHPDAHDQLDYEGELTVVIGKDAKNVKEHDALEYVLGYTAGNDVSARNFQLGDSSGGQFCYAKSFDGFGPVGPCIASRKIIPDPSKLSYITKVNGQVRQRTPTSDMIWSVQKLVAHLSRSTTLRKGTMIMTGTPSGVGLFMKPQAFLNNGDVVEVDIEQIGSLRNKMVFSS